MTHSANRARTPAATFMPAAFWQLSSGRASDTTQARRRAFRSLVDRVMVAPAPALYDAVEAGVPTQMIEVVADALGESAAHIVDLIGVSSTTFRRKDESGEPLPDAAGHRLMALLRVMAILRRLLQESGDADRMTRFDLEAWLAIWLREPLPALGNRTPGAMLRNPEGQRAVEQVLERMRGGLPA